MKIAFLHYHLKTGGVTTVLKSQISALRGNCETLVLTGDRAGTVLPCQVVEIPGLGYDRTDVPSPAWEATAEQVLKTLSGIWPGGCDVLHIHNPTLVKNQNFIQCIKRLQVSGVRLLLQIHDFAEDGRPGAFSRESYPENCHYGVINTRDKRILIKAGLKTSGVHLIPNTIYPLPVATGGVSDGLVLYPVRAIRRKNIGEAVLLSLYLRQGQYIGVTLSPNSRLDMKSYLDWRTFVKNKRLNTAFDLGQQHDFATLVGAASFMITTSIGEGFGFSFLEPWTVKKVLHGRRLGGICRDFERNGLCLDSLYEQLEIPLKWFQADDFFKSWQRAVIVAADRYGHTVEQEKVSQYLNKTVEAGVVDFGVLSEPYQRQVISYLLENPQAKTQLAIQNPGLALSGPEVDRDAMLENNHRVVSTHYDSETYREQLLSIYNGVIQNPVRQQIDKQVLIDTFFDLKRFSLLKWGSYEA